MQGQTASAGIEIRNAMFFAFCSAGCAGLQKCASLADAEARLESGDGKALLLYENPASVLAALLPNRELTREALKAWTDEAEQNLKVLRRHAGKTVVIERSWRDDNAALAAFQSLFPDETPPPDLAAARRSPAKIWQAIGALAVSQDRAADRLFEELQAHNSGPSAPLPDPASSLRVVAETLAAWNDDLRAAAVRQREEEMARNILVQQVAQLQTSLQAVAAAEAELNLVYQSTSWRLTAPIRAIRRLFHR